MAGELRALYRESMRLEAAFFSEQPGLPRQPAIGVLVVDFDETCTAADTTGVIIDAAIAEAECSAGGVESGFLTPTVGRQDASRFGKVLTVWHVRV